MFATLTVSQVQERTRKIGNEAALACIARTGLPMTEVRLGSLYLIRDNFNAYRVIQPGEQTPRLPRDASYRSFKEGWRGTATILEHGTKSCYNNGGCRCADCTEAWRVYNRDRKLARRAKFMAEVAEQASEQARERQDKERAAIDSQLLTEFRLQVGVTGADELWECYLPTTVFVVSAEFRQPVGEKKKRK